MLLQFIPSDCVLHRLTDRWCSSLAKSMALLAFTMFCAAGCQMYRQQGPVSKTEVAARELSQRGQNAMERGDLPSAETMFAQAVKTSPANVEARRQYAETLWQQGQRDLALQNEEKLL